MEKKQKTTEDYRKIIQILKTRVK